jgi:hypothetical protein
MKKHIIMSISFFLFLIIGFRAAAGPKSNLWDRWEAHQPGSTITVDHTAWDRFLQRYLDADHPSGIARLDYAGVADADKDDLDDYINSLQAVKVSGLSRAEQMAYWINLYNAVTVQLVVDNYPASTILRINPGGILPRGPWHVDLLRIEGEEVSLNDIEHRILRPIWKDPRIHFAVNCASLGCPNLQKVAFTAENTDELLDKGAREYINHPRGAGFDDGTLVLSKIFSWYGEDFGDTEGERLNYLSRFAEPDLSEKLRTYDGKITYEYDWDLNE